MSTCLHVYSTSLPLSYQTIYSHNEVKFTHTKNNFNFKLVQVIIPFLSLIYFLKFSLILGLDTRSKVVRPLGKSDYSRKHCDVSVLQFQRRVNFYAIKLDCTLYVSRRYKIQIWAHFPWFVLCRSQWWNGFIIERDVSMCTWRGWQSNGFKFIGS